MSCFAQIRFAKKLTILYFVCFVFTLFAIDFGLDVV